jgi:predicted outer membrane protein
MSAQFMSRATMSAAAASCLFVAYAFAQTSQSGQAVQPGQSGQQIGQPIMPPAQPPSNTNQSAATNLSSAGARNISPEVEQYLVTCLLTKNEGEVEIAKFAEQRTQNPQVKQFAQHLITDHQAAIQKIQRLAGNQVTSSNQDRAVQPAGYAAQSDTAQQAGATTQSSGMNRTADRAGGQSAALQQLAAIEKQIAERCQQDLREKLQSKQGAEFDHCFVGSQIASHMQMLAALEVIQRQTTGPLSQIAQESQPKVKSHLEMAEKLAEQLMASSNRQADAQATMPRAPR